METNTKYVADCSEVMKTTGILTREEEMSLFRKRNNTKSNARIQKVITDKIFNANLKMVYKIANQYRNNRYNASLVDLISAGCEGLAIAINRFDIEKGFKFSTYALPWIELKISDEAGAINLIRVPKNVLSQYYKYSKFVNASEEEMPSDNDIRSNLKCSKKELVNIKQIKTAMVSIDEPYSSGSSDDVIYYRDIIADPNISTSDEIVNDQNVRDLLDIALNTLKPEQKEIILKRYLSDNKENLKDIGKRIGLTGERVRQIERIALKKMKWALKNKTLTA